MKFNVKFTESNSSFDSDFKNTQVLKGEDGFSPIITTAEVEDGYLLTIEDKENTEAIIIKNGRDGDTPIKGEDYYTEEEKENLIEEITDQLALEDLCKLGDTLVPGEGQHSIEQAPLEEENRAVVENAVALGEGSVAGGKGYWFEWVNFARKEIVLTNKTDIDERKVPILTDDPNEEPPRGKEVISFSIHFYGTGANDYVNATSYYQTKKEATWQDWIQHINTRFGAPGQGIGNESNRAYIYYQGGLSGYIQDINGRYVLGNERIVAGEYFCSVDYSQYITNPIDNKNYAMKTGDEQVTSVEIVSVEPTDVILEEPKNIGMSIKLIVPEQLFSVLGEGNSALGQNLRYGCTWEDLAWKIHAYNGIGISSNNIYIYYGAGYMGRVVDKYGIPVKSNEVVLGESYTCIINMVIYGSENNYYLVDAFTRERIEYIKRGGFPSADWSATGSIEYKDAIDLYLSCPIGNGYQIVQSRYFIRENSTWRDFISNNLTYSGGFIEPYNIAFLKTGFYIGSGASGYIMNPLGENVHIDDVIVSGKYYVTDTFDCKSNVYYPIDIIYQDRGNAIIGNPDANLGSTTFQIEWNCDGVDSGIETITVKEGCTWEDYFTYRKDWRTFDGKNICIDDHEYTGEEHGRESCLWYMEVPEEYGPIYGGFVGHIYTREKILVAPTDVIKPRKYLVQVDDRPIWDRREAKGNILMADLSRQFITFTIKWYGDYYGLGTPDSIDEGSETITIQAGATWEDYWTFRQDFRTSYGIEVGYYQAGEYINTCIWGMNTVANGDFHGYLRDSNNRIMAADAVILDGTYTVEAESRPIYVTTRPAAGDPKACAAFSTNYKEGDEFSIINGNHLINFGKITKIVGDTIYYDSLTSSFPNVAPELAQRDDYLLYVPSKPLDGIVPFSRLPLAHGYECKAVGDFSTADGYRTIAAGAYGRSDGQYTFAGYSARASGDHTKASAKYSSTDGYYTQVLFQDAGHAQGMRTTCTGYGAHIEGYSSLLLADALEAYNESHNTSHTLYELYRQAELLTTIRDSYGFSYVWGTGAHVEGKDNIAIGNYAHAGGVNTRALAEGAFSIGNLTVVTGKYSFAGGNQSSATHNQAFAFGYNCQAQGVCSVAMGSDTFAIDPYTFAIGFGAQARGTQSVAIGTRARTNKGYAIVLGGSSANALYSCAFGYGANANADYSIAIGNGAIAGGLEGIAIGKATTESSYALAMGFDAKAKGVRSVAIGYGAIANHEHSIAIGLQAKAYGGDLGDGAVALGYYCQAHGAGSLAGGKIAQAYAESSIALGFVVKTSSAISAVGQMAIGKYNKVIDSALLIVGNGTSESNRRNAFEVRSVSGKASIVVGETEITEAQLIKLLDLLELQNGEEVSY